jgi:hypothetical protein
MPTDQPPPLSTGSPPSEAAVPRMSWLARLLNIFAIPGAVFEDVKLSRFSWPTWIMPIVLAAVVGSAALTFVLTPEVLQQFRDGQKETYAKMVAEKKMAQSDADQMLKLLEWLSQPAVARAIGSIGVIVISILRVFWWAFALWLLARIFLKVRLAFPKTLEIAALATLVIVLASLIGSLLTFRQPPAADDTIAETVKDLQARSRSPLYLVLANVFSIWFVGLLSAGLARLAGARFAQTFMMVMGVWIAVQLMLALLGLAALSLAK